MLQIFISYRREDSREPTARLYDRLIKSFGEENIFKDDADDNILPGTPFPEKLEEKINLCDVLLIIIGTKWINIADESGVIRLENPEDFLRKEIEMGLGRAGILIIPVRVNGASMPTKTQVPTSIAPICEIEAAQIRDRTNFDMDLEKLINRLKSYAKQDIFAKIQKQLVDSSNITIYRLQQQLSDVADNVATKVEERLLASPLVNRGIRLVASERRGYEGYYTWIISNVKEQELFFAGRSVLHRIDADVKKHRLESVERVLADKLKRGATIDILFLDPRSNLLDRLAKSEGQKPEQMLEDISISLGICKRFYDLFQNEHSEFTNNPQLRVRLYDDIPYFSYHKENDKVIIGFYFSTLQGFQSAAFEALDTNIKEFFKKHFENIFSEANHSELVRVSRNNHISFERSLYQELQKFMINKLGEELASRRFSGDTSN